MEILLNSCLLCFLVITVVAIVFTNDLFNVGILTSVYSFFMTLLLFVLDAVDVAMTEAAVGAGITTVLLLGTVYLVGNKEIKPLHKPFLPTFLHIPFNKLASPIKFATNWLAGFSYIEFGSPICCISPSLITAILSDIVKASSWSCVTKTNVIPVSL